MLGEVVLGGSETLFAKVARRGARAGCCSNVRRVEEGANTRHGFHWALFHQPMPIGATFVFIPFMVITPVAIIIAAVVFFRESDHWRIERTSQ